MEDQFGGRTDDDLFYDDFEPVESEAILIQERQEEIYPDPDPVPDFRKQPLPLPDPVTTTSLAATPPASSTSPEKPSRPTRPRHRSKGQGLASSRFADQPVASTPKPPPSKPEPTPPESAPSPPPPPSSSSPSSPEPQPSSPDPPPNAPTAPRELKQPRQPSQNTAATAEVRMRSGGNPRQKLTEAELSAKMEKMKLLNAEKTRQFEKAERDERQHAEAYARGMEEARKRRAEEAERRRLGEEDRRKLEDERAKNRERKLKAMSIKDDSWDEGKDVLAEEDARRGFRGANGGVRGRKSQGLGGSRFASREDDRPDVDRFLDDRYRDRGGGRGRGSRGRSGFGGNGPINGSNNKDGHAAKQAVPKSADFPALPSDSKKRLEPTPSPPSDQTSKPTMAEAAKAPPPPPPPLPEITGGKWDDEMEALDELQKQSQG